MKAGRAITLLALVVSITGLAGCKKKQTPLPPQTQAPTITPEEKTAPAPAQPPVTTTGAEPSRPQPEATAPPKETAPKPTVAKPKARKPAVAKKTVPAEPEKPAPAAEPPARTVVPEAGTPPASSGQIVARLPHDEAIHQKMNTAQLLEATESNLRSLARALTADEQAMAQHIRSYMQQARDAVKEGDVERAYNLALKAHLLSDELVKR